MSASANDGAASGTTASAGLTAAAAAATATAAATAAALSATPTPMEPVSSTGNATVGQIMRENHTGNSMASTGGRVSQSRYFSSATTNLLNGGNNFTTLSSLHLLQGDGVGSSSLSVGTANATLGSHSTYLNGKDGRTFSNGNNNNENHNDNETDNEKYNDTSRDNDYNEDHHLNVKNTLKHLDLDEADDSNDYSFNTMGKPNSESTPAPMQQPTLTGSTNNSFSSTWISNSGLQQQQKQQQQQQQNQQQQQLLLQQQIQNQGLAHNVQSVTPWIEQQAQLSHTFHHFNNGGGISSHSTGNDSNLATNLSVLTTNSLLSNPMSQISQQQQLRQPQYMKINSISPPNTNENNISMNTNFNQSLSQPQSLANKSQTNSIRNVSTNKANSVNANTSSNSTNANATAVDDDELIPTAIVIKNIPFAIKKEQLLEIMSKLSLPLPYAFNYHFDNGVFRGLAFANFNSIEETAMVVNVMNGREIDGRKLRVEYKKMLPLQERERIEREKKEKRCQLEEQHRSSSATSLTSLYSTASAPPSTSMNNLSALNNISNNNANHNHSSLNLTSSTHDNQDLISNASSFPSVDVLPSLPKDVDFNNKEVLELYTRLILFKETVKNSISPPPELQYLYFSFSETLKKQVKPLCAFLDLTDSLEGNVLSIKSSDSSAQIKSANDGGEITFTPSISLNPTSAANLPPSLIRSHSQNLINSNPSLSINSGRFRQQSPRTVSQNQQYLYNTPQTTMGLTMSNMNNLNINGNSNGNGVAGMSVNSNNISASNMNNNLGLNLGTASLQQLQQQQQHQSNQLHHSSSTASLNLLRNKGLTAPTTPVTARQSTFPSNGGLPNLFSSNLNSLQQPQSQQHGMMNQASGYNYPQITGGSNISISTNRGLDELYTGMEYLSFDNGANGNAQN